jgi:hypothetical protein
MFFSESMDYRSSLNVEASETGLTPDMAGVYRLVSESTEEWYNLREKMMKVEHVSILREDAELLSEGAKEFFGKISGFFKKMLAKVKEIWKKFTVAINQAVMNDKDFIKKYEKVLRNKTLTGFETKGHKWKDNFGDLNIGNLITEAKSYLALVDKAGTQKDSEINRMREHFSGSEFDEEVRAKILGASGKIEASDFAERFKLEITHDKSVEVDDLEMRDLNMGAMIDFVKGADKNIKEAQKDQAAVEKLLEDFAKFFDGVSKKLNDQKEGDGKVKVDGKENGSYRDGKFGDTSVEGRDLGHMSSRHGGGHSDIKNNMRDAASVVAGGCRKMSTIATQAFGMLISEIRNRRSEYRSILAKMVTYKPKSEGYDFVNESSSILDQF